MSFSFCRLRAGQCSRGIGEKTGASLAGRFVFAFPAAPQEGESVEERREPDRS
jgi:hypothetical protein